VLGQAIGGRTGPQLVAAAAVTASEGSAATAGVTPIQPPTPFRALSPAGFACRYRKSLSVTARAVQFRPCIDIHKARHREHEVVHVALGRPGSVRHVASASASLLQMGTFGAENYAYQLLYLPGCRAR